MAKIDGRTREARLRKSLRAELEAHLGGKPTITQRLLIDQACNLQLHVESMNRKWAETGTMTDFDSQRYLAWTNSLERLLRRFGHKAYDEVDSLDDLLHRPAREDAVA